MKILLTNGALLAGDKPPVNHWNNCNVFYTDLREGPWFDEWKFKGKIESESGEMKILLTNIAPLAADEPPVSHPKNCNVFLYRFDFAVWEPWT